MLASWSFLGRFRGVKVTVIDYIYGQKHTGKMFVILKAKKLEWHNNTVFAFPSHTQYIMVTPYGWFEIPKAVFPCLHPGNSRDEYTYKKKHICRYRRSYCKHIMVIRRPWFSLCFERGFAYHTLCSGCLSNKLCKITPISPGENNWYKEQ